jgi:hypothetical protein
MALGEYPVVTLGEARDRHLAARKVLARGTDGGTQGKRRG